MLGLLLPDPLSAQPKLEVVPVPRFDIKRFVVIGNTLLPAQDVEGVVALHTGGGKDFADIQRALEALERVYRDRGYGLVQVVLPEQDITGGVVRFRVVQPRVGNVVIEGHARFNVENIRRSLPSVTQGETPNSIAIARNLQLLGEHPAKHTSVLLRSGATEDQVDVNVKVTDGKPWRAFFTLDDTGGRDSGKFRAGFGYQHSNLFNRDHSLTAHYVTSPSRPRDVTLFGAGYRIPLYDLNSTLDLIGGYSDVNAGAAPGLFNVSGRGTIGALRWSHILRKLGEIEHKLALGLDHRAFREEVQLQGRQPAPTVAVRPLSLTYSGLRRMTAAELSFHAGVASNIPGGRHGQPDDFQRARAGADDRYRLLRYGFNYSARLANEWQLRMALNGQHTGDSLVPGEQHGIGGPDSVRGYRVREVTSDRGMSSQIELSTPDLAGGIGFGDRYKVRGLAFHDWGQVTRNRWQPIDGVQRDSIASAGLGLRLGYGKALGLRLDLARTLQPTAYQASGSQRLSAALAIVY